MNGKGLLMLTKKDFIHRSPMCGDILYESLVSIRSGLFKRLEFEKFFFFISFSNLIDFFSQIRMSLSLKSILV